MQFPALVVPGQCRPTPLTRLAAGSTASPLATLFPGEGGSQRWNYSPLPEGRAGVNDGTTA
ncbi:MAG: hypothetical protein ACRD18_01965, partial [Terriglobia bacterium]